MLALNRLGLVQTLSEDAAAEYTLRSGVRDLKEIGGGMIQAGSAYTLCRKEDPCEDKPMLEPPGELEERRTSVDSEEVLGKRKSDLIENWPEKRQKID